MVNSDIKLKRKVQLRKKVEDPALTVETEGAQIDNTPMPQKNISPNLIWVILGIIAICVICYFIFFKSEDTSKSEPVQKTEIVEETIVSTSPVSDKEKTTEENLSTPDNEVSDNTESNEAGVNDAPVATDNNPNVAMPATNAASLSNVSSDVDAEAMKVIRGDYGVGLERKNKLGTKYQTIQSRVNELKREGVF